MKNPRVADEWEPYIRDKGADQNRLTQAIKEAEGELNDQTTACIDSST